LELPLLKEIREFPALPGGTQGSAGRGKAAAKLERRYQRLCFVQESLEHVDFKRLKPGQDFEAFMLGQADFSRYALIDEKIFTGLFIGGLDDYPDSFFGSMFGMNREAIRALMLASYAEKAGKRLLVKNRLFILSVMRSLHSSLDFAPLWDKEAVVNEIDAVLAFFAGRGIIGQRPSAALKAKSAELFLCLLNLFHHTEYFHEDGVKTKLYLTPFRGYISLAALFSPLGKAHSLSLVSSGFPSAALPEAKGVKDLAPLAEGLSLRL
ncbi:MAG: hypothetical protein LBH73_01295, partial [Spirochaetaceae bacterium]|nr:hypothetical protein [Spirochaetaceae bacterium]